MESIMLPFARQNISLEIKYNLFDLEEIDMTPDGIVQDLAESLAVNNLQLIANAAILQQPEYFEKLPECLARTSYIRTTFFSIVSGFGTDENKRRNLRPSIERYNQICVQLKDGELIALD